MTGVEQNELPRVTSFKLNKAVFCLYDSLKVHSNVASRWPTLVDCSAVNAHTLLDAAQTVSHAENFAVRTSTTASHTFLQYNLKSHKYKQAV